MIKRTLSVTCDVTGCSNTELTVIRTGACAAEAALSMEDPCKEAQRCGWYVRTHKQLCPTHRYMARNRWVQ